MNGGVGGWGEKAEELSQMKKTRESRQLNETWAQVGSWAKKEFSFPIKHIGNRVGNI